MAIDINDIRTNVRDTLADPTSERWEDDFIDRFINRAVQDFTKSTGILRRWKDVVEPTSCPHTFRLPSDMLTLTRATFEGVDLPIVSHSDMDRLRRRWQLATTTNRITHLVYDKKNKGSFRLYPTPTDLSVHYFNEEDEYGVLTIPANRKDGAFHDISKIQDDVSCGDDDIERYGILIELDLFKVDLDFYYSKSGGIELLDELDDMWLNALVHYVCGHILRSDRDEQARQFGAEELRFYYGEVTDAKKHVARDFTHTDQYNIAYRRL